MEKVTVIYMSAVVSTKYLRHCLHPALLTLMSAQQSQIAYFNKKI